MNPKLELVLTYLTSIFALVAAIKAYDNKLSIFNAILLIILALIWFISAIIKSYKYRKHKKIY